MTELAKPRPLAVINEALCIGCTKCIQACPVDAILGSAKNMHTVIADECIGCKLCLPPCPVDCIDLVFPEAAKLEPDSAETKKQKTEHIKMRVKARQQRLQHTEEQDELSLNSLLDLSVASANDDRKAYVKNAVARYKLSRQLP